MARPDATLQTARSTSPVGERWPVGANARGRMDDRRRRPRITVPSFPPSSVLDAPSFSASPAKNHRQLVPVQCRCRVQQTVPTEDSHASRTDLDHNPSRKRLLVLRGCSFTSSLHARTRTHLGRRLISVPGFDLYENKNSGWSEDDDAVTLGSTAVCRPARHRDPLAGSHIKVQGSSGTARQPLPVPICGRVGEDRLYKASEEAPAAGRQNRRRGRPYSTLLRFRFSFS